MPYPLPITRSESVTLQLNGEPSGQIEGVTTWSVALTTAQSLLNSDAPTPHPWAPGLVVSSVTIEPLGDQLEGGLGWENAKLTISYAPPPEDEDAETLGEETLDFAAETLTLPKSDDWEWASDGKKLSEDEGAPTPFLILPKMTYRVRLNNIDDLPLADITNTKGKVNSSTFRGFAAETMLFYGGNSTKTYSSDPEEDEFNIEYVFEVNPHGWNKMYRPSTEQWERLNKDRYQTTDFNDLFN